ncbi:MAG: hypothetical protein JJU05_02890 [Verrucomicrobia bacterium]|nr:hypothetical protein [Verrucomicrobiota bacterium]MCH8527733.1 hypothetical protein [Kiritimatiellia bacterium]
MKRYFLTGVVVLMYACVGAEEAGAEEMWTEPELEMEGERTEPEIEMEEMEEVWPEPGMEMEAVLEPVAVPVDARRWIGPGRGMKGLSLELLGGVGGIRDVEGRVTEQIEGRGFTGALNLNLSDLGVEEGSDSQLLRAKLMNSWVTFFLNYHNGSVSGQGTTESDVRLNVDGVEFGGRVFDYLLIPEGGEYTLELENTWLGFGMQFTPFTINPDGRLRATPWLHLGLQYVEWNYTVDAGATTTVQFDPETQRTFAFRGNASSEERALMPEYGFGGEIRLQLRERAGKRVQLVGDATYKRLDLEDGFGSLSFDNTSFEDVDFSYTSLEMNLYVLFPVNERVDFLCGVYVEQVEMSYTFAGDRRVDGLDRDVTLEYTLYGIKAGVKF